MAGGRSRLRAVRSARALRPPDPAARTPERDEHRHRRDRDEHEHVRTRSLSGSARGRVVVEERQDLQPLEPRGGGAKRLTRYARPPAPSPPRSRGTPPRRAPDRERDRPEGQRQEDGRARTRRGCRSGRHAPNAGRRPRPRPHHEPNPPSSDHRPNLCRTRRRRYGLRQQQIQRPALLLAGDRSSARADRVDQEQQRPTCEQLAAEIALGRADPALPISSEGLGQVLEVLVERAALPWMLG